MGLCACGLGGLGLGQVFDTVETEEFEEAFGRAVEDGSAGLFGAPGVFHQMLFHKAADGFPAGASANGLYIGAKNRLFVGNDCQGFEGGLGELRVGFLLVELLEMLAVSGEREDLISAGDLLNPE